MSGAREPLKDCTLLDLASTEGPCVMHLFYLLANVRGLKQS